MADLTPFPKLTKCQYPVIKGHIPMETMPHPPVEVICVFVQVLWFYWDLHKTPIKSTLLSRLSTRLNLSAVILLPNIQIFQIG